MAEESSSLLDGLRHLVATLARVERRFAVVGGIAVAVRGEPRFTRDIDVALATSGDRDMEGLVFALRGEGYEVVALVEHEARARLATARLVAPGGLVADLIAATSGIETEVVERATPVLIPSVGEIPIARAEELLAMKVLSMSDRRPQDRTDAIGLLLVNLALDLEAVRANLGLIAERGFDRGEDLGAKLASVLEAASRP